MNTKGTLKSLWQYIAPTILIIVCFWLYLDYSTQRAVDNAFGPSSEIQKSLDETDRKLTILEQDLIEIDNQLTIYEAKEMNDVGNEQEGK